MDVSYIIPRQQNVSECGGKFLQMFPNVTTRAKPFICNSCVVEFALLDMNTDILMYGDPENRGKGLKMSFNMFQGTALNYLLFNINTC